MKIAVQYLLLLFIFSVQYCTLLWCMYCIYAMGLSYHSLSEPSYICCVATL